MTRTVRRGYSDADSPTRIVRRERSDADIPTRILQREWGHCGLMSEIVLYNDRSIVPWAVDPRARSLMRNGNKCARSLQPQPRHYRKMIRPMIFPMHLAVLELAWTPHKHPVQRPYNRMSAYSPVTQGAAVTGFP